MKLPEKCFLSRQEALFSIPALYKPGVALEEWLCNLSPGKEEAEDQTVKIVLGYVAS